MPVNFLFSHCGTTETQNQKNNCSLFSSTFHIEWSVSRYGRFKLKFLCKRFSHCCIYSFCSIELTKTRNTRSLTAVCHDLSYFQKGGNALFRRTASGNVEKCNKVLRKCVQELLWTNAFDQNIFEWRNVSRAVLFWFRHWCSINHLKVVFSVICLLWLCLKSRPRARKEHEFDA